MARPLRHGCLLFVLGLAACDLGAHVTADGGGPQTPTGPSDGCSGACHGAGDSIAPPRDTQGHSNLTAVGVGAHSAHLSASTWHKRFDCATCHVVPQNVGDAGHILVLGANGQMVRDPLPAELVFNGLGLGASWDHATATCTNSYCHGDTLKQVDPATNQIVPGGAGGLVTQPVWTLVDGSQSKCGSCHGNPPPAPHPQQEDCGLCHQSMNPGDYAAGKISYPELHIDGKVEVSSTQPCDSCHGGGGQYAPPKDAHGNTATTARGVGAHAQHMIGNPTWHAAIQCNECHLVPGSTTDQTHLDSINEVYMDPTISIPGAPTGTGGHLQIPGAIYDSNTLTCTNTFCHGGGQSPLLGGSKTNPLWTKVDGTQDTCGSCHGAPPPLPHPQAGAIHDCGTCHPTMPTGQNVVATSTKATITISLPAQHIDGNVQVINDQPCNNCHGDKAGTPVAGDNKVNAPPTDTTGGTSTTLRGVGAHQAHMADNSSWRAPISCGACHKVPATMESIGHIDTPLPAEIIFGTIAGTTAAWNGSTCANVYCHGATLRNTDGSLAGGTATKPVWTLVDGSQSTCGSCHGLPPPPPHPVDSDCGKCHAPTMTAGQLGVIANPATHIDGSLNVNTDQPCNSCHGSAGTPTMNGAPINAPPKDTAGNTALTARGVGAHQAHLAPTSPIGKLVTCADCHMIPGAVGSVGHIDTPLPAEVVFSSRAGTSPTWNGAQCANVYCHGSTLTQPNGTGAGGTATSPLWTKVDGSQKACTACHGNPPPLPHIQDPNCQTCHMDMSSPTTFSDVTKHIDGNLDVSTNQACNACHGDHGTATTNNSDPRNAPPFDSAGTGSALTLRAVGAHQKHLQASTMRAPIACVNCHLVPATYSSVGHVDTPLPAEVIFTGVGAGSTWNGSTCSSYCHGTTLANGGGAVPNPLWTKVDGTQSQCNSCHGDPPTNSPHTAGNTNCGPTCHPDAMGNTINPAMAAMHIDGTVQVAAGSQHPSGYEMVTMHGYDVDKTGLSTCSTASCHGTTLTGGTTGGPSCATVTGCHDKVGTGYSWQTQCTFCHGDIMTPSGNGAPPQGVLGGTAATDPTVGAHQKHVAATTMHAAWDCTYCHVKPTNATNAGHIDGTGGIVQAELHFSSLNPASTYSFTAYTCASNYCHGNGRTAGTSPAWNNTTALTCSSCHITPAVGQPATGLGGEHDKHVRDKQFACQRCHSTVVNTTPTIINAALHVDGVKTVSFSNGGTYNSSAKSCTNTGGGCHGSGTYINKW